MSGDSQLIPDHEDPVIGNLVGLAPGELQGLGLAGQPPRQLPSLGRRPGLKPALRE